MVLCQEMEEFGHEWLPQAKEVTYLVVLSRGEGKIELLYIGGEMLALCWTVVVKRKLSQKEKLFISVSLKDPAEVVPFDLDASWIRP